MELIKSSTYQVRSVTSNDSSVVVGDHRSVDWIWSKSTHDIEWLGNGEIGTTFVGLLFCAWACPNGVCANGL